jgi:hypothetical protein
LAGCSLGNRLYFCVSKPPSGRRLQETEIGSRLTNGSCAMSLNSNHVVLNTMPNVFVDVGLPVKDLPRSGRPRVTSDRDDRALQRLVRRIAFATSPVLKQHWLPNIRLSTRTVRTRWQTDIDDHVWGIDCIFVSPNPHPAVGYMKQKPALV